MTILKALCICLITACVPVAAFADNVTLTDGGGAFPANVSRTGFFLSDTGPNGSSRSMLVGIQGLASLGIPNQTVVPPASSGIVSLTTGMTNSGGVSNDSITFNEAITNGQVLIGGTAHDAPTAADIQLAVRGNGGVQDSNGSGSSLNSQGTTNFASPAPEPVALTLLGTGLISLGFFAKRRASRKDATSLG